MKYLILMFVLFHFSTLCFSETLDDFHILGNVYFFVQIKYQAEDTFGTIKLNPICTNSYEFNDDGYLDSYWSSDDPKIYEYKVLKNEKDLSVINDKCISYIFDITDLSNTNDILLERTIYKYDINHKLSSKIIYNRDGTLSEKITYKYDGENLVEETSYSGEGTFNYKDLYYYDDEWNLVYKKTHSTPFLNVTLSADYYYHYDAYNNIIWEKKEDLAFGDKLWTYEYQYDEENNIIKKITWEGDKVKILEVETYLYFYM